MGLMDKLGMGGKDGKEEAADNKDEEMLYGMMAGGMAGGLAGAMLFNDDISDELDANDADASGAEGSE